MEEKKRALEADILEFTKEDVVVAFSGGADSALILKLACDAAKTQGSKVYAITVRTKLHPHDDMVEAQRVCEEIGAIFKALEIDEFSDKRMMDNPKNRCYICKYMIFSAIKQCAAELDIQTVLEGTNEDDLHVYRPGIQALKELGIISPLAACGITKQMVRGYLEELGISVAKKPAAPCLATRIPYGDRLEEELLSRIEKGERYLKELGLYNVRIRVHGTIARIEIDKEQMDLFLQKKEDVVLQLKNLGFLYITLDLEGFRSGSMDVGV